MAQIAGIGPEATERAERMAEELRQIDTALAALNGSRGGTQTGGRTLSASARARIAAAQKARRARVKDGLRTPRAFRRKERCRLRRAGELRPLNARGGRRQRR